jgi:phosphoribosylformimino-5-aminoimidazole carboxamide ribotide isomerase
VAAVILYPAIDLKDGQCVRVVHGDFATATVFNDNPANQAEQFARAGFDWLHVIDLNGSAEGRPVNAAAVEAILEAVSLPVQLGGGIRSLERIEAWIEAGVSRVILGTVAVRDPALVKEAAKRWPEQIAVSVDVRKGQVAVQGWLEDTGLDALTVARRFEDVGVSALIITDIDRDGSLQGFNVEVFGAVADAVAIPVIAAGGLTTTADILALRARKGAPIAGAVLGRAIYAGTITAREAIAAARGASPAGAA